MGEEERRRRGTKQVGLQKVELGHAGSAIVSGDPLPHSNGPRASKGLIAVAAVASFAVDVTNTAASNTAARPRARATKRDDEDESIGPHTL